MLTAFRALARSCKSASSASRIAPRGLEGRLSLAPLPAPDGPSPEARPTLDLELAHVVPAAQQAQGVAEGEKQVRPIARSGERGAFLDHRRSGSTGFA